jgi:hypothetical protein
VEDIYAPLNASASELVRVQSIGDSDEHLTAAAQLAELKRHLADIQWNGDNTSTNCPACGAWEQSGHEAHCWIRKALK